MMTEVDSIKGEMELDFYFIQRVAEQLAVIHKILGEASTRRIEAAAELARLGIENAVTDLNLHMVSIAEENAGVEFSEVKLFDTESERVQGEDIKKRFQDCEGRRFRHA